MTAKIKKNKMSARKENMGITANEVLKIRDAILLANSGTQAIENLEATLKELGFSRIPPLRVEVQS